MMGKIRVFNFMSIDGFFAGPNGEIDWFKTAAIDEEWNRYSHEQEALGKSTLIFGRTTYEMMKSYWPTEDAIKNDPQMAGVLNNSRKIVFSKTLKEVEENQNLPAGQAGWKNVKVLHKIKPEQINELKKDSDITILGSGSIIQQFTNLDLIDKYSLVVVPIILGVGKSLFKDVKRMNLNLQETKAFKSGIVLLKYIHNGKEV